MAAGPPQVPIPYPSDIMVRERTILINLEAIRLIITKDQVRQQAAAQSDRSTGMHRGGCMADARQLPCCMHVLQSPWPRRMM